MDVIGDEQIASWDLYLDGTGKGRIKVLSTVHHPAQGADPARNWVLFEALVPLVWDFTTLPTPNTAAGVNSEEDTVSKPDPPSTLGSLGIDTSGIQRAVLLLGGAIVLGAVVVSLANVIGGRRSRR